MRDPKLYELEDREKNQPDDYDKLQRINNKRGKPLNYGNLIKAKTEFSSCPNEFDKFIHYCARIQELSQDFIPLLKQNSCATLTFSRDQIAQVIATMAFNCFRDPQPSYNSEHNFNHMYPGDKGKYEALKCLIYYFHAVCERGLDNPNRLISFTRTHCSNFDFAKCQSKMNSIKVTVKNENTRGEPYSMMDFSNKAGNNEYAHVNFANAFLGGGTLAGGLVQEEILFLTHVECIAGMTFCEKMRENEAIIIQGARCITQHRGYRSSFKCDGPCDGIQPNPMYGVIFIL
ncbi:hypothetical protein Ciccas_013565 [Cichlidogyrus casuarinus]|uniref:poly(ADP-ribose) glycohydrolase n=1 Tax=Cichlidogyrus casuarinus TaxID=1844966 RepID=A0ABD2PKA3_9PLAT